VVLSCSGVGLVAGTGSLIIRPMLLKRIEETEQHLRQFIAQHLGVELKRLTVETPPRTEFGDLAFPFSFELAKTLRRSPREIALQVA